MKILVGIFICLMALGFAMSCSSDASKKEISRRKHFTGKDSAKVLKWGEIRKGDDTVKGNMLTMDGVIASFVRVGEGPETVIVEYGNIDYAALSGILRRFNKAVLDEQVLYYISDVSRFVEYESPGDRILLKYAWGVPTQSISAKPFIELYDTLNAYADRLKAK